MNTTKIARNIELKNIDKIYNTKDKQEIHALSDISFNVQEGEFVSIVGPSGCGKSTLLDILCGLLEPTSGEAFIGGERLKGPRRDSGVVFQEPLLLPWLTVLENVLLPVKIQSRKRSEYEERAKELLELVGINEFANNYPKELSGGMQQRVGIVRALVHDPTLLLMDEPFSALDAMTRESMTVELQNIWSETKKTVLFITHSISEAVFLSDKVIVMTPRPGSIAKILTIDLPRLRNLEMMNTTEFGVYIKQIRSLIDGEASNENIHYK